MCAAVLTCAQVSVHDSCMATTSTQDAPDTEDQIDAPDLRTDVPGDDCLVYNVADVERVLRISRSTVYTLIRTGQLATYRVCGSRKVDKQAVLDYLASVKDTSATES